MLSDCICLMYSELKAKVGVGAGARGDPPHQLVHLLELPGLRAEAYGYVCMYVCMDGWTDGWIYIYIYIYMYVCMYIYIYIYIYMCGGWGRAACSSFACTMDLRMVAASYMYCTYIYIYIYIHTCIFTYMYVYVYIYMYNVYR